MKYKLLRQTIMLSKLAFYGILLNSIALQMLWAIDLNAQEIRSVKEVEIFLNLRNANLVDLFKNIEKQTNYSFSYNVEDLDKSVRFSNRYKRTSVADILLEVSKVANLKFKQVNNSIHVSPARENGRYEKTIEIEIQTRAISGKVTSAEDGEPLPGVSIVEKGTSNGTVTDIEGQYKLTVADNAILIYSSVGYTMEEISVGQRSTIDLVMVPDIKQLEELVVVGYGVQKKSDLTSAISTVSSKEIQNNPVANWNNALQGLSPGVEVQGNQGRPGSEGTIRIRGVGSISGATNPLVVVDGVPMGADAVMPSDIESVEILKDAASGAMYGSRGANGVILITTKKGKVGKPVFSVNSYYGVEEPWKQMELMNAAQWADLVTEVNENAGKTRPAMATWIKTGDAQYDGTDTDWQDAMFQSGRIQEHSLSVSGGNEFGNYYISGGYYAQDGIMRDTEYQRMNFRINSTWKKGIFTFGENFSFRYQDTENEDNGGGRTHIEEMLKQTGPVKIYNSANKGGFGGPTTQDGHDATNPVGQAERTMNMNFEKLFSGVVWGQFEIIKGLNYKMNFGAQTSDDNLLNWQLATNMGPKSIGRTSLQERNTWDYRYAWENTLNYQKTILDHDINLLVGYTSEYSRNRNFMAQGNDIASEDLYVLGLTEADFIVNGAQSETALASVLGRLMYSYKGKYLLTANIRRDEVGKFKKNNRVGVFPSFSAGWRVSDEPFMSEVSFLNNFKIRGSYGTLGNQAAIANYATISGLTQGANYTLNNGETGKLIGVTPRQFANPDLKWETVIQSNIGFDVTLFEDLDFTFDYYVKKTEDMLVNIPIPSSSGSVNAYPMNAGSLRNSGIEFQTTYRKSFGDLNLNLTANFATINNEVTSMGVEGGVITSGSVEFNSGVTRTEVGKPIGTFYGYVADGIFMDENEVLNHKNSEGKVIQPSAKPGDIRFLDLNNDGQLTDGADKTHIGSPIPDFMYGMRVGADYKGLDFSMFFQGVEGNEIYAELVAWTEGMHNNFNAWTAALNRFPHNTTSGIPRAVRDDPNGNIKKASTRYIKDGSYLRMKNIMIGYTLPAHLTNSLGMSRTRIYFSGRNLLTFTKYPFYDPEIGSNAQGVGGNINTARGIDNGYYPQARTLTLGVQIDF